MLKHADKSLNMKFTEVVQKTRARDKVNTAQYSRKTGYCDRTKILIQVNSKATERS